MSIKNALWISDGEQAISPIIRKRIVLNKPISGKIEITGLGFFTLSVNGKEVTHNCHMPALTDYEERDTAKFKYPIYDQTNHRILYLKFDLTEYLIDGENTLEIHLGPGWYRQEERNAEGNMSFGKNLKTVFYGEAIDNKGKTVSFSSDGSEEWCESEIIYSNLFIGEIHDARYKGIYKMVKIIETPKSQLCEQVCPNDRIVRKIVPIFVKQIGDKKIYDAGENITGWVCVTTGGNDGEKVTLRFAENISDVGIDVDSTGGNFYTASGKRQTQTDTFICSAESTLFRPKFIWHGFRYFDIEGEFDDLWVEVVHTDVPITSKFSSSNALLNKIYSAYIRSQLGNYHSCIPTDCPHRERLGYTGDGQITARTAMMTLDSRGVYDKWIDDILDCQDKISGHIQHTAPLMGGGGGPGGWGCAVIIVPDEYDKHYNDIKKIEKCYPAMKKWISYLKAHSEKGIVVSEEKDGWCLGDWAFPGGFGDIPAEYVNTCFLLDSLYRIERIAKRLNLTDDAKVYRDYANIVRNAIIRDFYSYGTGSFCNGNRGADAYALWVKLDQDNRTLENLIKHYTDLNCFDTGFLGTEILIKTLIEYNQVNLAFDLLTANGENTYGKMLNDDRTTLCEFFDLSWSHNHHMFGAPVLHFFDGFLGIRQAEESFGYEKLIIEPKIPAELACVSGEALLPIGKVAAKIERINGKTDISLYLPTNAVLCFGGKTITVNKGVNSFCFGE